MAAGMRMSVRRRCAFRNVPDQLDPLNPSPHDPDFRHDSVGYHQADTEKLLSELNRLIDYEWDKTKATA